MRIWKVTDTPPIANRVTSQYSLRLPMMPRNERHGHRWALSGVLPLLWMSAHNVIVCAWGLVQPIPARRNPSFSLNAKSSSSLEASASRAALENVVCLVTGASRGIGKGIALELGAQGATVYVTGTTTTSERGKVDAGIDVDVNEDPLLVGTIDETAALVTKLGGKGIAIRCNHGHDADVQAAIERIVHEQGGRLDILVNNAFRLPKAGVSFLNKKFWEQGAEAWDSIHEVGLRSHYMTTYFAMPLLFESARQRKEQLQSTNGTTIPRRPLIVMIGSFGGLTYTFNVAYGVGKAGVDRMAKDMAVELTEHDICVVSLWPGVVDTERTQISVKNGDWERYVNVPLDYAESPQFTGRAVVALATDANNMAMSGTHQVVAELAQHYGFTDIDGTTPPSIRSLRFLLPTYGMDAATRQKIPVSWIPDLKLPFWLMAQGKPPETRAK